MIAGSLTGDQLTLPADHTFKRLARPALAVGVIGLGLAGVGALASPQQFFRSYLFAFLFWCGLSLGSFVILMIQHITGGRWGALIRRVLECSTRGLPLLAVLFVPIVLGIHQIYEWADAHEVAEDAILQHKSLYLNPSFFTARAVFYFAIWILFSRMLNRWSLEQDKGHSAALGKRLTYISRGGLLLYALTMTFAAIDWVMSLEPHWFSTIYGLLLIAGQVLSALAFSILVTSSLSSQPKFGEIARPDLFQDLGKLLLGFTMVWAYFSFSQFLIIWMGNLPEEIPWYLNRLYGGWQYIGVGLILFHFALPFALLLSRGRKRDRLRLRWVALIVIAMRVVDLFWLVTPTYSPRVMTIHWLDVVTFIGIGGVWLAMFCWQLQQRPLLPLRDPELA